jgi:hypothetical protein
MLVAEPADQGHRDKRIADFLRRDYLLLNPSDICLIGNAISLVPEQLATAGLSQSGNLPWASNKRSAMTEWRNYGVSRRTCSKSRKRKIPDTGWDFIRLYLWCVVLTVFVTLFAAVIGSAPLWLWSDR